MSDRACAIDPGISSYLDALRICAALIVFFSHYIPALFGVRLGIIPGHDAVVVFFVMSGYVIAYVSEDKDRPAMKFAVHRIARLWSVLLPSVVFSIIAALLVPYPSNLDNAPASPDLASFITASVKNIFFLGECWGQSTMPYNGPVWSLDCEAWYYAIFATFIFVRSGWRWVLAGIVAVAAGPSVIPMFPCWLIGCALYKGRERLSLRPAFAWVLIVLAAASYCAVYHYGFVDFIRAMIKRLTHGESYHLGGSSAFPADYILSLVVAISILWVQSVKSVNLFFARTKGVMQFLSSRTLSLYLYHVPLLAILYAGLGFGKSGMLPGIFCIVVAIGLCITVGAITEAKVRWWRHSLWRFFRRTQMPATIT